MVWQAKRRTEMRQKVLFLTACVLSNLVTFLIVSNTLKPAPVLSGSCLERAAIGFKTSRSDESRVKIPSHETSHVQTACIDSALAPNATVTARPCQCEPLQHPTPAPKPHTGNNTHPTPPERTIFFITPTYARSTQKSDLTSVCVTLMHVQKVVWIIVEDSEEKSDLVKRLLNRCTVTSVHLNAVTPKYYKTNKWKPRGVLQRNAGLTWVRNHHTAENCTGIVYFGDDDNSYDLKIFIKMRETVKVSVWPVAFSGGVKVEGPMCKDGVVSTWHNGWGANRPFPIDMAGFAINLCLLMQHPTVVIGKNRDNKLSKAGYLESNLLEQLIEKEELECRGPEDEVIVWHVKTERPDTSREAKNPSDPRIEV